MHGSGVGSGGGRGGGVRGPPKFGVRHPHAEMALITSCNLPCCYLDIFEKNWYSKPDCSTPATHAYNYVTWHVQASRNTGAVEWEPFFTDHAWTSTDAKI